MASRVIGKYELFDMIAAGGMATVHFGRFQGGRGFSRTVALKRLHPQFAMDPDFVAMFLDEARVASRISHPNVVTTLDVVSERDELLLVMDYVVGDSLSGLIRAMGGAPVPTPIALTILTSILHGLHAAHEATTEQGEPLHLIHRDVSPQNILVGRDGVSRVLDFGIAKAARRAHTTKEGLIKGKLAYMAPEQLERNNLDRRSDVYGAAVVLWECLTGERLFQGETEAAIVMQVLHGEVPTPSSKNSSVSPVLDPILARALARNPNDRFSTAREMAIALERCGTPLAPISEVGEWVESLAGGLLSTRALRVVEMERGTDPDLGASALVSEVGPTESALTSSVPVYLTSVGSDSSVSGSALDRSPTSLPPPMARRRPRQLLGMVMGMSFVAVVALGARMLLVGSSTASAKGARVTSPSSTAPNATSSSALAPNAAVSLPIASTVASAVETPPVPSGVPSTAQKPTASAQLRAPRTSASVVVPKPKPPVTEPQASTPSECSVPYVVDSSGIRQLKPECL